MRTFLKILGGILLFLVVLAVGLNLYFTDERLKRTAMPYLNDAVGREVQVGEMSLTFWRTFPRPGLSIDSLSIPGDAPGDTLLSLDRLVLGAELFPLFRNEFNVTEVHLNRPRFQYRVYEDGSTNLDFFFADSSESSSGWSVSIPYFRVDGGHLAYRNDSSGTRLALDGLGGDLSLQYDSLITTTARLHAERASATSGGETWFSGIPLTLSQESLIDTGTETLSLEEGSLSIRGLSLQLQGSVTRWSEGPDLDLRFTSSTDDFGELLALLPSDYVEGLETRGSLSLEGSVTGTTANGAIPAFDATLEVREGYVKNPDLPRAIEEVRITARADNNALTLTELTARAGENTLRATGTLADPLEESGAFEVDLEADVNMETVPGFYDIGAFGLQELGGQLTVDATLNGHRSRPREASYDGTFRLQNGSLRYRDVSEPIQNIELEAVAQDDRIVLRSLAMEAAGNSLRTSGTIRHPFDSTRTVDLDTQMDLDLSTLDRFYPVTGDSLALPGLLVSLGGSAQVDLNARGPLADLSELEPGGSISVTNVHLSGDQLPHPVRQLSGELRLTPVTASLNSLNFDLGESQISINGTMDRYRSWLKPLEERTTAPRLEGTFRSNYIDMDQWIDWEDTSSAPVPIHLPHLTSEVDAEITRMKLTGVTLSEVRGRLSGTPQQVQLGEGSARLLGGTMTGSITWNVPQPDRTEILFEGSLDSLQAASFFEEYPVLGPDYRFGEYLQGSFNATVEYRSELDEFLTPVLPTTSMSGRFGMSRTRLEGHPIQQRLSEMLNLEELLTATLDEWTSTFRVDNSMLTVDSLRLTSGSIGAELNGTRNLVDGTVDLQLLLYLPDRYRDAVASVVTAQAVDALTQENGALMLPLRITGTIQQPRIAPDRDTIQPILQNFLKEQAGGVLRKLFDNE